jgi:hypothetical protein
MTNGGRLGGAFISTGEGNASPEQERTICLTLCRSRAQSANTNPATAVGVPPEASLPTNLLASHTRVRDRRGAARRATYV